jgi:uncharacterized membrane protein required for colicin V production
LDIAVALVLVAGIAIGFWTGLIWQLVCLASVIGCLWASVAYHPVVAEFFGARTTDSTGNITTGIGTFICLLLVCYLVSFLFRGLINAIRPQLPDRALGAVFGLVVAALIVGVLSYFILRYTDEDNSVRGYVGQSKGAAAMAAVVRAFVYVLPDSLREGVPSDGLGLVSEGLQQGPGANAGAS